VTGWWPDHHLLEVTLADDVPDRQEDLKPEVEV
jgi:hypothetical protein